ncbi:MAG: protein phosphatase 2C domain-containing protein, partial [Nevskiales bacterium]|nr:protein phosphatase 2C domain-containing protein [Nevskiales bacterium]
KRAVEQAHQTVRQVSLSQPQCAGMGTTLVTCLFHDDRLAIAYVGDSRVYRLRVGQLEQITRDHSLLEELVARGHYTREEAKSLSHKNIVTRAVGVEPEVKVDLIDYRSEVGDIVLLCTDGLYNMLDAGALRLTLSKFADNLADGAQTLVNLAKERGGKDNISVALARVDALVIHSWRWYQRLMEWF